jgi:hypothetical protein
VEVATALESVPSDGAHGRDRFERRPPACQHESRSPSCRRPQRRGVMDLPQADDLTAADGELLDDAHIPKLGDRSASCSGVVPAARSRDPVDEFGVGGLDAVAVELEEGQHGDEREPLVAVDEELPLGDAVGEHRRLQREVGVLVVGVGCRSGERGFQARSVAQVVGSVPGACVENRRVQLERVLEDEVDRLVACRVGKSDYRGGLFASGSCSARIWSASRCSSTTRRPTPRICSRTRSVGSNLSSPSGSSSRSTDEEPGVGRCP